MNLTKPSVEAALRASIKKNDKGFTVRDMHQKWGFKSLDSSKRKMKEMVDSGIFECVGKAMSLDCMGRPHYSAMYRVVKKEKGMNKRQFIAHIMPQLDEYGVELCLEPTRVLVDDNLGCFDYSSKRLCVASLHRDAFQILLHEYCHFLQWTKRPFFFDKMAVATHNYLTWLDSNKPINGQILADKKKSLTLEWDCERRALKLIDSLNLRISKESYARKANAYLLTYHMATSYHKWPTKLNLRPTVQSLLPNTLLPLDKILDPDWMDDRLLARMKRAFL